MVLGYSRFDLGNAFRTLDDLKGELEWKPICLSSCR
jgi:hypothetical protein